MVAKKMTALTIGRSLVLATEELGGVRTGRRRQVGGQSIYNLLLLGHGKPRKGSIHDQLDRHTVDDVLRADQGISRSLLEVNTKKRPLPLTILVRDGHLRRRVVLKIGRRVCVDAHTRKRMSNRVDCESLRVGKRHGITPSVTGSKSPEVMITDLLPVTNARTTDVILAEAMG